MGNQPRSADCAAVTAESGRAGVMKSSPVVSRLGAVVGACVSALDRENFELRLGLGRSVLGSVDADYSERRLIVKRSMKSKLHTRG